MTRFTAAVEIVNQLHTVLRAKRRAWIGQAFVDISFASRPHKTGWTFTLESANLVDARTVIVAGIRGTVVDVDITNFTQGSLKRRSTTLMSPYQTEFNFVVKKNYPKFSQWETLHQH